ncbi:MAG TPA: hypothetical protein VM428_01765, partial [Microlunatus sp.]|nr:hypothetical protein [Microlunatus sp.]
MTPPDPALGEQTDETEQTARVARRGLLRGGAVLAGAAGLAAAGAVAGSTPAHAADGGESGSTGEHGTAAQQAAAGDPRGLLGLVGLLAQGRIGWGHRGPLG